MATAFVGIMADRFSASTRDNTISERLGPVVLAGEPDLVATRTHPRWMIG